MEVGTTREFAVAVAPSLLQTDYHLQEISSASSLASGDEFLHT